MYNDDPFFECRELAKALVDRPVYFISDFDDFIFLSDAEKQYIHLFSPGARACTNPINDVIYKNGALRYLWEGRGTAITWVESPYKTTITQRLGMTIHELCHSVDSYDNPERDDTDHNRAVKAYWDRVVHQGKSDAHGDSWQYAVVHAWHVARRMGYEIPLYDTYIQNYESFNQKKLARMLKEATLREDQSIESALRASPFSHQALAGGTKENRNATSKSSPQLQSRPAAISTRSTISASEVAVVPVVGILGGNDYADIRADIAEALGDSKIKTIVLYMNSPGGSAIGPGPLADFIYNSRGVKPIVAYAQSTCGSAAYYIAAACDKILATADALVGGVGAIFPHQEQSGWQKRVGIGVTVFSNEQSPKKGHGNPYEPLSDDSRKTLQDFVDSYGKPFIEDVAKYRGVSVEDVETKYRAGDVVSGRIAFDNGMVDQLVGVFGSALESLGVSATRSQAMQMESTATALLTDDQPAQLCPYAPLAVLPTWLPVVREEWRSEPATTVGAA